MCFCFCFCSCCDSSKKLFFEHWSALVSSHDEAARKKTQGVWAIRRWWVPTRKSQGYPNHLGILGSPRKRKIVGFWQLHPRLSWFFGFLVGRPSTSYGFFGRSSTDHSLEINQPSWNESYRPFSLFLGVFSRSNVSSSDPTTAEHEVWTKRSIFVVEMAVPGCKSIESTWIHVSKLGTEKIQP